MTAYTTIDQLDTAEGHEATIGGWLYGKRSGGKVIFLLVRDGTGECQCVAEAAHEEVFKAAEEAGLESSVEITGTVRREERAAGGWEIAATGMRIVQQAENYPVTRKAHGIDFLMQHRHLWLRSKRQSTILRIRHTLIREARNFFDDRGFTLIDTPIITTGSGEDTQTLFPVEYFDEKMFLTQTGQLHLECAALALRKVYCFGPTFRAEKSKTRRHLTEFWMLEPEIAYADLDDVIALAEDMTDHMLSVVLAKHEADLEFLGRDTEPLKKVKKPYERITYSEAVEMLKSSDTLQWLEEEMARDKQALQGHIKQLDHLENQLKDTGKAWKREKLQREISELRELVNDLERDLENRPEHIRLAQSFEWGKDLGGSDETIIARRFDKPVFVTDYPREAKAFYMKVSETDDRVVRNVDMLAPEGYGEVIGGAQREDNYDVLIEKIKEAGLDPADYSWYTDLRKYGSVPHGGFGLGIERMLSWVCGLKHVRECIPFPRLMGRVDI